MAASTASFRNAILHHLNPAITGPERGRALKPASLALQSFLQIGRLATYDRTFLSRYASLAVFEVMKTTGFCRKTVTWLGNNLARAAASHARALDRPCVLHAT
jgi:hypothetical protein